jgi:hypothetical protein
MSSGDNAFTFTYTPTTAIVGAANMSVVFGGFSFTNQYNLQFQVSNTAFNGTAFKLNIKVYDDSYSFLTFFLVYNTAVSQNFFEIIQASKNYFTKVFHQYQWGL